MKIKYLVSGLLAALLALPNIATAQAYPTKPIKIIVPTTPGGGIDIIARVVADKLEKSMGQPVTVENKPGAGTTIGTDAVAKAAPDGYTIGIVGAPHTIVKFLYKDLGWDPEKSFEPIVYTHSMPMIFAVSPQIPAKSIPELVTWLKANPNRATIATTGRGSPQDMSAELFRMLTKVDAVFVPYKGSTVAHPDLISGRVTLMIDNAAGVTGHIKAGTLRGIGVSTMQRIKSFPDLATANEQGLKGFNVVSDGGMVAPAGTPKAIIDKLNAEIVAALKSPDVIEKLTNAGIDPQYSSPQEYAKIMKAEITKWEKFTKELGLKPE